MKFKQGDIYLRLDGKLVIIDRVFDNNSTKYPIHTQPFNWAPQLNDKGDETYTLNGTLWETKEEYEDSEKLLDLDKLITKEKNSEYFL